MNTPIKILVVDDEPLLRLGMVRLLKKAGYDVLEAATGEEGLRLTRAAHPDILLLDVVLPDLNGIAVCQQIKADPALSETHVVLLSGMKTSSDDQADGLECGADDYIGRPIANRELLARINAIVRIKIVEFALRASEARYRCLFTEQKQADEALRVSEMRYRNLFNAMSDAILLADDAARYVDVNPAACELFGYSREEFLQLSVWDITPIPNREQGAALWQAFMAKGAQQGEFLITRKDGQARILDYRAVANIAPGRHLSVLRDITAYRRAEEERRRVEERYAKIFSASPIAIGFGTVETGHFVDVNQRYVEFFGYSREELLDMSAKDLWANPAEREAVAAMLRVEGSVRNIEVQFRCRSGEIRAGLLSMEVVPIAGELYTLAMVIDITARKQAEEILKQYQQIVSSTPDGISLIDREYRYRLVNNAYETFSGVKPEQLLGRTVAEYLGEDVFQHDVKPHVDRCLQGETIEYQEWFNYSTFGKRFVHVTYFPYRDAAQNIVGVVANTRDVTEIKRAEEALRQSEQRYRQLIESLQEGIWVYNEHTCTTFVNPRMAELLGYTVEEMVGRPVLTFTDERNLAIARQKLERRQQGIKEQFDFEFRRKDGTPMYANVATSPIIDDDGHYRGAIVGIMDITDRKQMERALQEREALYRQMFLGHSAIKLLIEPATGAIVEANPSAAQFYGYSLETLQQMNLAQINTMPPVQITRTLSEAQTHPNNYFVFQHRLADGTVRDVEVYSVPITIHERTLLYAVIHDITTRKQAEAALQQYQEHLEDLILARTRELQDANRQLAEEIAERQHIEDALHKAKDDAETANRAKSRFLANMSHELRSPLNAILGFSQLLERSPETTPQQREYLEVINRSGAHLLELINDVLELSKIETGQSALTITTVDLRRILADLESMLHVRTDRKGLRLLFEIAADVPGLIQTDQCKLRQILINLLENAVKFTDAGQVALRVNMRSDGIIESCDAGKGENTPLIPLFQDFKTPRLHFEISDTGVGIAAADLPTLFTAFTQTPSGQQQVEGTGLGLALSRQFAQALGGDITVASRPGKGSAFTLILPIQLTAALEQALPRPARQVVGLAPAQPEYRILVVDDDVDNQLFLRTLLQKMGFTIQTMNNGERAITAYQDWQPHLILMDMRMPGMDGYTATQKIRELEPGISETRERADSERSASGSQRPIPIIAVTASAFAEERDAILAAGCDDFVRKPFRGDDILKVIQRHLGVQYQYAEPERRRAAAQSQEIGCASDDALRLSERIAALAPNARAALERAAYESDVEALDDLLAQIGECDVPLADALTRLSKDFKYDEIMRLIQETTHDGVDKE